MCFSNGSASASDWKTEDSVSTAPAPWCQTNPSAGRIPPSVVHAESQIDPDGNRPPLTFPCVGCGLTLSIDSRQAGTSGPCPSCGAWITSPAISDTGTKAMVSTGKTNPTIPTERQNRPSASRRKGRIPADSMVDQTHLHQRESAKTLMVLALFILTICACLAVAWFMKDWMAK